MFLLRALRRRFWACLPPRRHVLPRRLLDLHIEPGRWTRSHRSSFSLGTLLKINARDHVVASTNTPRSCRSLCWQQEGVARADNHDDRYVGPRQRDARPPLVLLSSGTFPTSRRRERVDSPIAVECSWVLGLSRLHLGTPFGGRSVRFIRPATKELRSPQLPKDGRFAISWRDPSAAWSLRPFSLAQKRRPLHSQGRPTSVGWIQLSTVDPPLMLPRLDETRSV